jgi:hypothetical protein
MAFKKSRRDFIVKSTVAGAGFFIVPRHVLGGPGFTAPSDQLAIAAIGSGGKGGSELSLFAMWILREPPKRSRITARHPSIMIIE